TVRRARFLGPDTVDAAGNPVIAGPGVVVPGPGLHQQDAYGQRAAGSLLPDGQTVAVNHAGTHQVWPVPGGANAANFARLLNWPAAGVEPITYHIRLQVSTHKFTTSKVRPINKAGLP